MDNIKCTKYDTSYQCKIICKTLENKASTSITISANNRYDVIYVLNHVAQSRDIALRQYHTDQLPYTFSIRESYKYGNMLSSKLTIF